MSRAVIDLLRYEDGVVSVMVWDNDDRDAGWEVAVLPTMDRAIDFAKRYAAVTGATIDGGEVIKFPKPESVR